MVITDACFDNACLLKLPWLIVSLTPIDVPCHIFKNVLLTMFSAMKKPNQYLLVQSQHWKHRNKEENMFKVNRLFSCFRCWVWASKCRLQNNFTSHEVQFIQPVSEIQASIYLLRVNNKKTRIRCKICPTLTIKTPVTFRQQ